MLQLNCNIKTLQTVDHLNSRVITFWTRQWWLSH